MKALFLAFWIAALAIGCGGEADLQAETDARRRHLILISIDTLRADRLGCYGYGRATSPTLDALAGEGVRFETVIAESNWTLPSHMTLFTGLAPTTHGVTQPTHKLAAEVPTLATVLEDNGFRTFGITGTGFLDARFGFSRGFEAYHLQGLAFAGALNLAQRRIARLLPEERFFAFLHTYDVHCPYDPPARYARQFETQLPSEHLETRGRCGDPHFNAMSLTSGQAAFISDRYDASIRYVDDLLGVFLSRLERAGLREQTIIAVLSDHGEEFLEHGRIGHRDTLYIESLRVPWILSGPGLQPGVIREPVGLADVMPTLLDLLGIPAPPTQGRSLRPLIEAGAAPRRDRAVFSESQWQRRLRSAVVGNYHLIADAKSKELMLFDWRRDPREQENLMGRDSERDRSMKLQLLANTHTLQGERRRARPGSADTPSREQRERLRTLGYVE